MTLETQLMQLSFIREDKSLSLTVCDYYSLHYSGLNEIDSLSFLRYKYEVKDDYEN